jgi:hypothetical protein
MEDIEHKQSATEATGHIIGLGAGALQAACRGKHVSAAIIVLAGAILLLGESFIIDSDAQLFVQIVGVVFSVVGLAGWLLSTAQSAK